MLSHPVSRRRFIASASTIAAVAGAVPAARFLNPQEQGARLFVSAEHVSATDLPPRALLLDGPRLERLQAMAASLPQSTGEVVLRLDATDDHLFDIAAQQAGVSIKRGAALANGSGIRAHITSRKRNFA